MGVNTFSIICEGVNGKNLQASKPICVLNFCFDEMLLMYRRLYPLIYFRHFKQEAVLILTHNCRILLLLIRLLTYFITYTFAAAAHHVRSPFALCSYVKA